MTDQPIIHTELCESPIERFLAEELMKTIRGDVRITPQLEVPTDEAVYRLDFALSLNGRVIGLECDGKEYHDEARDAKRDESIVKTGKVHAVYRFRGTDLFQHIHECLKILLGFEPRYFSERGAHNVKTRSDRTRKHDYFICDGYVSRRVEPFYELEEDRKPPSSVQVVYTGKPAQPFYIHDEFLEERSSQPL